ncbi:MAG: PH domain-containing protein [Stackebrandtia sp.]
MTVVNVKPTRLRFRRSGAQWLAAIVTLVFVVPFAGSVFAELDGRTRLVLAPIAAVAVLVPMLVGVWTLRSGVDATAEGLTVRALFGARSYAWSAIKGFDTRQRTVYALLEGDRLVPLPAIRPVDVPRLIEAGGGELSESEREPEAEADRVEHDD